MPLAWALLVIFCGSSALAGSIGTLDPGDGTLLAAKDALRLFAQCSQDSPNQAQGAWDPTIDQIRGLELRLPQALADHIATHPTTRQALNNEVKAYADESFVGYDRQYGGLLIAGRTLIYVNAFPKKIIDFDGTDIMDRFRSGSGWRYHPICPADAGHEFFGVLYDPKTGKFDDFQFTGHF